MIVGSLERLFGIRLCLSVPTGFVQGHCLFFGMERRIEHRLADAITK